MSPQKKKMKLISEMDAKKHTIERKSAEPSSKRIKADNPVDEDLHAKRRKNFITACERVSCKAYFDHHARLLLIYLPSCMKTSICKHHDTNITNIQQMPNYAEESFKIEMKANIWYEALEVCQMCITPTQYLSDNVLKDVVEIMLNAHDDECSEYSTRDIVDKCQQILSQNFSTHPPCLVKSLRNTYKSFLTSPMDVKKNTFSNRSEFECNKGIVKYCMNRLEYEISSESKDEPLVNKDENIPEEMQQTVQGLHWQKQNFEIYEVLERPERIERLMSILESLIELLQFDLGIWHSRYTNNLSSHIMRSHKPLMAYILWSNNVLYTGAVNNNCRQILRLFVNMVHLQYSDVHVRIITTWLNTMVQTFYICETNSNSDYPNTGKYCRAFAYEFYKIISEMPQDSIIKILERIEPTFIRHHVALLHTKKLLSTDEDCIIKIITDFVAHSQWKTFLHSENDIKLSKALFSKPTRNENKLYYYLNKCLKESLEEKICDIQYQKLGSDTTHSDLRVDINHVVHTIYITLDSQLDAFNVQDLQETWEDLNEQSELSSCDDTEIKTQGQIEHRSYTVTEQFIKKYRYIYQALKELVSVFKDAKNKELPKVFNIFHNIDLLEL